MSSILQSSSINWRKLLLPFCALLGYWLLLIHQLGAQWSVYDQYSYGWAVPVLCAYLLWQRLRAGEGETSNIEHPLSVAGEKGLLRRTGRTSNVESATGSADIPVGKGHEPQSEEEEKTSNIEHPPSVAGEKGLLRRTGRTANLESRTGSADIPVGQFTAATAQRAGKDAGAPSAGHTACKPTSLSCSSCVSWLPLTLLLVLCALLYAPTRLLHEANPIWRVTSWLWTLEVIVLTLGTMYLLVGARRLRHFAFPIAFFLVAVPWPTIAERTLVETLTGLNVTATIELLNMFGIPALQHGNVIEITTGVVGVDEACSGIRSFQATLMISLFFGELYSLTVKRRVVCVFLGFALSFIFNVGRTFLLTYVASRQGVPAIDKWHDPAGVTVLVWCFVALWFAALVLKRDGREGRRRDKGPHPQPLSHPMGEGGVEHRTPDSRELASIGGSETLAPLTPSLSPSDGERVVGRPGEGTASTLNPQLSNDPDPGLQTGGNIEHPTPNIEHRTPDSRELASTSGAPSPLTSPSPDSGLRTPDAGHKTLDFRLQTSDFRLRTLAIGLITWLVLVEVGVQAWYRWHERSPKSQENWSLRLAGLDSSFKKIETPASVLRQFNADENTELRWQDQDQGANWQLYYFRWLPAHTVKNRVTVQLAKTHGPEKCLPAAGMRLESYLGIKAVQVEGLTMALQHYVFGSQGRPVHVFYAIYEDPTGSGELANRRRDFNSRVAAALAGSRNYGQRFLELAVWGIADPQQAEAALQKQLEQLVRVTRKGSE